jgi:hypothetical protein
MKLEIWRSKEEIPCVTQSAIRDRYMSLTETGGAGRKNYTMKSESAKENILAASTLLHNAWDVIPPTVTTGSTLDNIASHFPIPTGYTGTGSSPLRDFGRPIGF